ncbi:MAG: hypothetical protein FJX76_20155 [Armatimonadetes bacterium]|nr:hypothetical protein [Armatimonadota bacterium]
MNPLSVAFWLLGLDAAEGFLAERGFLKAPHPESLGSSVYRLGAFSLHSMGLWLDRGADRLVYHRAAATFYLTRGTEVPPTFPPDAYLLPFDEGFAAVRDVLLAHERWIADRRGGWHRHAQMERMPLALIEHRPAWEETLCCATGPKDHTRTG